MIFEDFGEGDQDDTSVYFVEAGVSCTINDVTATGPFLTGDDNTEPSEAECTKDGIAFDPIDVDGNRVGAHPIGFTINFFGTEYSDLYFSENGNISFDAPTAQYDDPLAQLALDAGSSVVVPFGMDLFYDADESSMWTAQTTVDGKSAFVISWQSLDECCDESTPDDNSASFQFVILDDDNGNFTAYFNYDEVQNILEGYNPSFMVDMRNGVTVGSNIVSASTVAGLRAGICEPLSDNFWTGSGTLSDTAWVDNSAFAKLASASQQTVSIWKDASCTTPNNISVIQDISEGPVYSYLGIDNLSSDSSIGVGWGTYNQTTGATDITELFANSKREDYFDGGSKELISYSLNTAVPGRIVLGQVGGSTTGAPSAVTQKVNAGSFKGYTAVYAKGYEGQRLSAKVGNDWVIVPSIPAATNDLYRYVEPTGVGVDIAVRIYIDRVLVDTINLTTK